MSYASASYGRAPSQRPSHPLSPVEPQQSAWSLDHQNTTYPNFRDTRFDDPRCSVVLPNTGSLPASRSQVTRDLDRDVGPSFPHLPFTAASSCQSQNFHALDPTPYYAPAGPLPNTSFVTDATALRQPTYPPSYTVTSITHPTMSSAGPSRFGCDQPTRKDHTTQVGPVTAAHVPAFAPPPSSSLPLQSFNMDPRAFPPLPTVPAAYAQVPNRSNVDVTGWHQPREGGRASTRVPPRLRGWRSTRPLRPPLVRVEDQVVCIRPHVLKVTLWLNWSPNAEAEAHDPWD